MTLGLVFLNFHIPADKSTEFNISFLSGLFSGLVSGIISGIIVGLILWKLQKISQESQEGKESEKEFVVFIQQLKHAFSYSSERSRSGLGHECLPENIRMVLDLLNEKPLSYWEFRLSNEKYRDIMNSIRYLQEKQVHFKEVSNNLDVAAINRLVSSEGPQYIEKTVAAFYSLVNGQSVQYLLNWFDSYLEFKTRPVGLENLNKAIDEFPVLIDKYKRSQEELVTSVNVLKLLIHNFNT